MEDRIKTLTDYFARFRSNNKYYVAMKHYAAMDLMRKGYRISDIAKILNINHATIYNYKDNYQKHEWADDFIKQNFARYIETATYPYSSSNSQKLKEKQVSNPGAKIEKYVRPYSKRNVAFGVSQKYVDICEIFGMNKKTREERMIYNRNYLILYLRLTYNTSDRHLCQLFGITHSSIANAIDSTRRLIADCNQSFYRTNEQLRYILHGDTRTGKIFLWSKGKGSAPSSDEVSND